jgi:hypothetical protein
MKIIKKYTHYVSDKVQVELDKVEKYNVYVVYYINGLVNSNYLDWLYNQLTIINYGCPIYIVATILKSQEKFLRQSTALLFPTYNIHIECYYTNEYEYRGILKVWELAQKHYQRNDIILYFHSKGVTRHNNYSNNKNDKYNIILKDLDKIKEIFTIFPIIDKVGYSCSKLGWIWYNFWFVRGSYAHLIEKPIKTERRHYYEDWLVRKVDHVPGKKCTYTEKEKDISCYNNSVDSCYGFYTNGKTILNIGSGFDEKKYTYKKV